MATVRIGISGWRYTPWRGVFYPHDLPQRRELWYASRRMQTIEINGSFYSLQRPEYFQEWHDETPDDFLFAVKGPRFITHMKKLRDVETPLANFLASGVFNLRRKLGPVLWQFPPNFRYEHDRMARFFELLPRNTADALRIARKRDYRLKGRARLAIVANRPMRHAVEIRHESFLEPSFLELLREHGIALVVAETAGLWPLVFELTADFVYMRLHGDRTLYKSGYSDRALERWATRIEAWAAERDVYCYFDNTDDKLRAPIDAQALMRKLAIGAPAQAARAYRRKEPERRRRGVSAPVYGR
jgi:uncharacterized protein YecE (DUF72 family)